MSFWRHHEPEFDEEIFTSFLTEVILKILEGMIMSDLTKLTEAVNNQAALLITLKDKVAGLTAHVATLESEIAASSEEQAAIDALTTTVEANNSEIQASSA